MQHVSHATDAAPEVRAGELLGEMEKNNGARAGENDQHKKVRPQKTSAPLSSPTSVLERAMASPGDAVDRTGVSSLGHHWGSRLCRDHNLHDAMGRRVRERPGALSIAGRRAARAADRVAEGGLAFTWQMPCPMRTATGARRRLGVVGLDRRRRRPESQPGRGATVPGQDARPYFSPRPRAPLWGPLALPRGASS